MSSISPGSIPLKYRGAYSGGAVSASWSTRASLMVVFFFVALSITLPFVHPSLQMARWFVLCTVTAGWLVFNMKWFMQLALPRWLLVYLTLYMFFCLASSLWSTDTEYTITRAISLSLLFVFLSVFVSIVRRYRCEELFCHFIAIYGTILLLPGLVLYFGEFATVPWTGYPVYLGARYAGMLWNPNQVAVTVVTMFPALFALWWKRKWRLWAIAAMAAFVMSLILCESRAGILGFLVGIATFFAVRFRLSWFVPGAAGVVLLCWVAYESSPEMKSQVEKFVARGSKARAEDISIAEVSKNRMTVWSPIITRVKQKPAFGWGFATGGIELDRRERPVHNSYLQVAQEIGLVGLAYFSILVAALLYALFKLVFLRNPVPDRTLYAGIAATVASGLVNAFFESWLFSVGNPGATAFWACAFLLLSIDGKEERSPKAAGRVRSGRSSPT